MFLSLLPTAFAAETDSFSSESLIKYGNIIMKKGEGYAYVRGELENLPAPYEANGVTYLPLRKMAEYLNTDVKWNSKNKTATWLHYIYEYTFIPGKSTFTRYERVEDTTVTYDMGAPAIMGEDGVLRVPFKVLSEAAGLRYEELDNGIILFGTDEAKYEASDFTKHDREFVEAMFSVKRKADQTEKVFYVDPQNGRDSYEGSLKYPFRTLKIAQEEVRKYKSENGQNGDIVVYLRGGDYYLTEPLTFGVEDSGLNGHKVIWSAHPGERVVLNGGRQISGWEKVDDNIYRNFVGVGKTVKTFYEGENYAYIARHPNTGYNTAIAAKSGASKTEFMFKGDEIPEIDNPATLTWSGWPGGPSGHWAWTHQDCAVKSIDYKKKTVYITGSSISYVLGTGSRYYVQGARELLDYPGEFYYDTDGWLYYWPISDDIENAKTIMPIENVLAINGSDANNMVENIRFENLNMQNTNSNIVKTLYSANIQFDGCELRNAGASGIAVDAYSPATPTKRVVGLKAENCGFYNMGSDAVSVLGRPHPQDVPVKYVTVRNCRIDNVGLVRRDSNGTYLYSVGYSYIGHNVVSNGGRMGIRLGGSGTSASNFASPMWGTLEKPTEEFLADNNAGRYNVVEYNVVTRVMDDSQDGGAIYTYDGGKNCIIRNNYMYDNTNPTGGVNVLYSDNRNPGISMYDNVVFENHTHDAGGYIFSSISVNTRTRYAKVFNNLTVTNPVVPEGRSRSTSIYYYSPQTGDGVFASDRAYWTKNISYDCGTSVFTNQGEPSEEHPLSLLNNNMYFDNAGTPFTSFGVYDEKGIKTAFNNTWEQHSLFGVDPLFLNREDGDLRLHYTSPAYRIRYRDVDFDIGLTDAFKLRRGADIEHMYVNIADSDTDGFVSVSSGEKAQLNVTLKDYDGYIIDDADVTYTSDNSNIASVDNNGKITAKSAGVARVTVTAKKGDRVKIRTVDVLVDDSIANLNADATLPLLAIGEKGTVRAWNTTVYGRQLPTDGIVYTSSDESILTIDNNGLSEAKAPGTAVVTAHDSANNLTAQVEITIKDRLFKKFTMETPDSLMQSGTSGTITLKPVDEKGRPCDIPAESVEVATSDEAVMTIEQISATEYSITPKASGTASISISVDCDGSVYNQQKNFYVLSSQDEVDTTWKYANYGTWDAEGTIPTEGSFEAFESGVFNLRTNGYNFWNTSDQGTFAYRRIKLDPDNPLAEIILKFDVTPTDANISGLGKNNAAFGAMLRAGEDADDADIHFRWGPGVGALFAYRNEKGGAPGYAKGASGFTSAPELRLIYDGSGARMYYRKASSDPWELFTSHTIKIENDEIFLGIAAYSQNTDANGKPAFVEMLGSVQINIGDDVDLSDVDYDIANAS